MATSPLLLCRHCWLRACMHLNVPACVNVFCSCRTLYGRIILQSTFSTPFPGFNNTLSVEEGRMRKGKRGEGKPICQVTCLCLKLFKTCFTDQKRCSIPNVATYVFIGYSATTNHYTPGVHGQVTANRVLFNLKCWSVFLASDKPDVCNAGEY